jgi:hypothetical protein
VGYYRLRCVLGRGRACLTFQNNSFEATKNSADDPIARTTWLVGRMVRRTKTTVTTQVFARVSDTTLNAFPMVSVGPGPGSYLKDDLPRVDRKRKEGCIGASQCSVRGLSLITLHLNRMSLITFHLTQAYTNTDNCQRCASRRERSNSPEKTRLPSREARSKSPKVGARSKSPHRVSAAPKTAAKKSRTSASKSPDNPLKVKNRERFDDRLKVKALQSLLPVVCKAGGVTLGKFTDDSRRKLFMCVDDNGTSVGGFLRAVCGSRYKVSPDLAVGNRATPALVSHSVSDCAYRFLTGTDGSRG